MALKAPTPNGPAAVSSRLDPVKPLASDEPRAVVVTGASGGIGAAVAGAMAAQGDLVAGISRSGTAPEGVLGLSADVTDPQALKEAAEAAAQAHGPAQVLIAAAGASRDALAARTPPQVWQQALETNLTGSFAIVRAVLPAMMRARSGRIILVSSVIAARGGVGLAAYGAAKAGVEGLTRSLARELAPRAITVNAVAPGFVETDMTASLPQPAREAYLEQIPLGRFAEPQEVVGPIIFLASPGASYITGTILGVDGGMGMGR
ncbi:3-oxoacyl-[acyl-carrier-protein] reductase FabG [Actinomyces slackii]|uniref:3-oxoacyl-[acyl-carrier-protein] reductase FabG n=1 Tax=Actinomyces slackii TaxID=52774 RepID=A0A448KDL3_9ACTO|nr:3-oxoacyl-[acyl-carrier-protein] reductase FabG [Actinomyces slackii]